jgi:hypothetical protein
MPGVPVEVSIVHVYNIIIIICVTEQALCALGAWAWAWDLRGSVGV